VTFVRGPEGALLPDVSGPAAGPLLQVTCELTTPDVLTACLSERDRPWRVTLAPVPLRRGVADAWRSRPDQQRPSEQIGEAL
jgi:hypothetical protein